MEDVKRPNSKLQKMHIIKCEIQNYSGWICVRHREEKIGDLNDIVINTERKNILNNEQSVSGLWKTFMWPHMHYCSP